MNKDRLIRRAAGRLRLVVPLAASAAIVGAVAAPAGAQVAPLIDCAHADPATQALTTHWGYVNTSGSLLTFLPGPQNFFDPPPGFQGQPLKFNPPADPNVAPGGFHNVFTTSLDLTLFNTQTWSLEGLKEASDLNARSCFTVSGAPERRADPSIIGSPVVGRRLALDAGVVAGDVQQIDVQWQRDEPAGDDTWEDISGAEDPSYVPVPSDAGHRLRVQIVARSAGNVVKGASDLVGTSTSVTDPSAAVDVEVVPVAGTPSITGTPVVGQTLTASPGTWTGVSSFDFDWQSCTAAGCTSTGKSGTTYGLTAADVGKRMRVVVTPDGASQPAAASAETDTVSQPVVVVPSQLTATPASVDFGSVRLGRVVARRVTVKNTGTTPVVIGGMTRSGAAAANFTPLSACALFARIMPGKTCAVDVLFAPTQLGARSAQLRVFDDQGGGPAPVTLSGNGVR